MEPLDPGMPGGLEQRLRPDDVRAEKERWIKDAAAVMGLRREIHDYVRSMLLEHVGEERRVGDVTTDEGVLIYISGLDIGERTGVARARGEVVGHDLVGGGLV